MSNDTRKMRAPDRRNGRGTRPRPPSNSGSGGMRGGRQGNQGNQGNVHANAKRNYERYMELARAAVSAGDTIEGENLYQHAEHYFRTMREQERGVQD